MSSFTSGLLHSGSASAAASTNPAIARCCAAWQLRLEFERSRGKGSGDAACCADRSFCDAMPALDHGDSIRDFIACTAYGMLTDKISGSKGTQLLYAAQVALTLFRGQSQEKKAPKKQTQIAA